ncbi:Hypothetical protein A7982_08995 [Minicystis rosea]|nr:Hypothetical protein A7982_08995 [Minicystis rosea]
MLVRVLREIALAVALVSLVSCGGEGDAAEPECGPESVADFCQRVGCALTLDRICTVPRKDAVLAEAYCGPPDENPIYIDVDLDIAGAPYALFYDITTEQLLFVTVPGLPIPMAGCRTVKSPTLACVGTGLSCGE